MKRITIIIAITMGCIFAGESNVLSTLKQIAKSIEAKYPNITNVSPSAPTRQGSENTNRDMGDIVGEWHGESRTDDMYITVGSDQTHPNVSQMMALEEGEGNIHVVTEAFETDLAYFLDPSIFDDGAVSNNRNIYALDYAQNYVDNNTEAQGQAVFDLIDEFSLVVDGEDVSGGLGGDNLENCEINWPDDPYKAAVYSFVSEYVLYEGPSVGCYFDYYSDQSYGFVAEELEEEWTGGGDDGDICIYLEMYDSECDGWNGAYWALTDEWGDTVETGTLEENACFGDVEICAEPGYYDFVCFGNGTDTDNDITWTLYDSNYEAMASGGANDGTSFYLEETDGAEGEPYGFIMNMNFMEFFMFMFGEEPLVENPTIVMFSSSTEDENIDLISAITLIDNEMIEFEADMETASSFTSVDTANYSITFSDLELMNDSGEVSILLSGTFGPERVDYLAGVETLIEFPVEIFDEGTGDDNVDFYTSFYSDSTGMDRVVEFDEESHETWVDTSYFEWMATADSLTVIYEGEDDEEDEVVDLEYMIEEDTLYASGYFYPCEEDYFSYEECLEDADFFFFSEFTDVEEFRVYSERSASWVGAVSTDGEKTIISESFALYQNFPNPFNPTTTIRFNVGDTQHATSIRIFDISGRLVESLVNQKLQPGLHEIQWSGENRSSGVYILRAENGPTSQTQKMVLMK
ncbi:MAG: T9SS type A sorting domain-containing protein [Candidatus Marinimicrobia bacterium]|nr:T9SS type A sorting domain-containing protein [Candidatus Neomarinimicrobiota bacterium]MBT5404983.1 T9SS type A sorting domain-containing protein [Candidatus Neomarinimicrobiota bacterium]